MFAYRVPVAAYVIIMLAIYDSLATHGAV